MTNYKNLFVCASGIFISYLVYGIVQERITRGKFVADGVSERFVYTSSLVAIQCLANTLFARAASTFTKSEGDTTSSYWYMVLSVTYIVAMAASNKSLQFIKYPEQVLGKACKPIPVMILGALIGKKRYPLAKYVSVILIVIGIVLFMLYKEGSKATFKGSFGIGELLLSVSLLADGITAAIQERIRAKSVIGPYEMMYSMNYYSTFIMFSLVAFDEGTAFVGFCSRHPSVLLYVLAFCLTSAIGQSFIFQCITSFGPLTCALITTTRKFFTILGSVIIFSNKLLYEQWIGVAIVFAGLFVEAFIGRIRNGNQQSKVVNSVK